jgi:hypothetical protein
MTTKKPKMPDRLPPRRRSMEDTAPINSSQPSAFDHVPASAPQQPIDTNVVEKAVAPSQPPVKEPTSEDAELALLVTGLGASIAGLDDILDALGAMIDD